MLAILVYDVPASIAIYHLSSSSILLSTNITLNFAKDVGDLKRNKGILFCCMFDLFFHLMLNAQILDPAFHSIQSRYCSTE